MEDNHELLVSIRKMQLSLDVVYLAPLKELEQDSMKMLRENDVMDLIRKTFDEVGEGDSLCRNCGKHIWWFITKNGKKAPYTNRAKSHFADCPGAESFRKSRHVG